MINDIKIADLDWHKNKVFTTPQRGNRVLVSYAVKSSDAYGAYNQPKTRCVWPGSLLNSDSKYLSRRVVAKTI